MDWFLYDRGLHHERVKGYTVWKKTSLLEEGTSGYGMTYESQAKQNSGYPIL